jgi:hypothetical protein
MLPFDESKKLLNKYGHNYTDEEIKIIREFISILIDIDFKLFKRKLENELSKKEEEKEQHKIIELHENNNETKSDSLHQGFYRRAS